MTKFSLGLDFGTESAGALLVETTTGEEAATVVFPYPHGVMDTSLDGIPLKHDSALQHPGDYLEFLRTAIPELLARACVDPADVVGIGVDFTSCTVLPTTADGTPLCLVEQFAREPHAYVKLWKHHAAQAQAERLNTLAKARGEAFLQNYGGNISAEWFFPKALEVLEEAPKIFETAERFTEGGDWIVWQLTGKEVRSACQAGTSCPDEQAHQAYERFFAGYERMAEHFGRSDQLLRELKMARLSAAKVVEAKP